MRTIDFKNDAFIVSFDFNADLVFEVKTFFKNRKFNPEKKYWIVYDSIDRIIEFANKNKFEILFDVSNLMSNYSGPRSATLDNNIISLNFEYSKEIFEYLKSHFVGVKYDTKTKKILLNVEYNDKNTILEFLKKYKFKYDFEIPEQKVNNADVKIKDTYEKILMQFQKDGVKHILTYNSAIIADEMGLGKTIQAIAAVDSAEWYPALIICPASLKYNWALEYSKWNKNISVSILSSKDAKLNSQINIINYDILDKYKDILVKSKFKSVVFDESQYIKNPKAKRTKAALKISKKVEHKILLSGTPINNRPNELISQIEVLGKLNYFGNRREFEIRYCDAHRDALGHWDVSGASNLIELHNKLKIIGMMRREKKEVLNELPEKTVENIVLELENNEYKQYKKAENDIIKYILEKALEYEKEHNLKGYAMDKVVKAKRAEYLVKLEALKQLTFDLKKKYVFEWIDNFLESSVDEKLVIFTKHRVALKEISEKYNSLIISGEQNLEDRAKAINEFQTGDNRIITVSIAAGREGITLTRASNMLFTELSWTPLEHMQAEDRIHRIGQRNPVNIYYMITNKTIETKIFDLIQAKKEILNKILTGVETIENGQEEIIDSVVMEMLNENT